MPFSKLDLSAQVSSEEEQEKPGNFIQGKPRMSLVRQNKSKTIPFTKEDAAIHPVFLIDFEYYGRFGATDTLGSHVPIISYDTLM